MSPEESLRSLLNTKSSDSLRLSVSEYSESDRATTSSNSSIRWL